MTRKQTLNAIISFVLIISILVCLIFYTGHLFRPLDPDSSIGAINAFHSMPENSLEVIVYGSSHAWVGLNVMEMYEKYGIGIYNYGCNRQRLNTTSLFFHDSLRSQSPKLILIETYMVNNLAFDIDICDEIYYTRAIRPFDAKKRYLEQCFGDNLERYLSYYVPFVAFHSNWNNLQRASFEEMTDQFQINFCQTMGYLPIETVVPIEIADYRTYEQRDISDESKEILDGIVQVCSEKNIQILFYTAPYQGRHHYFKAMEDYATENGCQYINLFEKMDEIGIDDQTDFYNEGHLNTSGALKTADYLGQYIIDHYELTDMRQIEGNIWEQNLRILAEED